MRPGIGDSAPGRTVSLANVGIVLARETFAESEFPRCCSLLQVYTYPLLTSVTRSPVSREALCLRQKKIHSILRHNFVPCDRTQAAKVEVDQTKTDRSDMTPRTTTCTGTSLNLKELFLFVRNYTDD